MAGPEPDGTVVDADRLLNLRHLLARGREAGIVAAGRPGGFPTRRRGNGLDIRDIRPYVDGDDFRHVDAMTTARTGRLHVRSFHDDRDKTALLLADFRAPMLWGTRRRLKSVAAAEALALHGWQAIAAGGRVGALVAGAGLEGDGYLPPRARDRAMAAVAGLFALAHQRALEKPMPRGGLTVTLERAGRLLPSGSTLYLATALDDPGDGFDAMAEALARRLRLVVLLVRDRFEERPAPGAYPWFDEPERIRWSRLSGQPAAGSLAPDPRPDRLARLGAEVTLLSAAAADDDLARQLFDGDRDAA